MTATCFPAARERCTARRWVGATHASPLPRRRLATSNSPVAHPVTLLHEDDTRTMHLVEHDSVCDGSHACVSSIPSVFTGRGEDTPTPARPRWGRESSAQAGGGRAGGRAPRRAIGRFPLSCLLSLYHPHPNPPPLGYALPTYHAALGWLQVPPVAAPRGAGFQPACRHPRHRRQVLAVAAGAQARISCNITIYT
ncbi:MAG: hypothetical protein KatS3mg056_2391 [Chloroflexus sp.]|jgi:hypothetical protein|nr:MAG: hypothetical protein KatS3mg056_2391 [Chloroflexus sp.]